jgi:signal peptidase II
MSDVALTPPRSGVRNPLRRLRQDAPFFLVASLVVLLDQLTKAIVRDNLALGESWPNESWLVKITHVTNTGAAFGMLQGQDVFLTVTAIFGMAAIIFYYAFPPTEHALIRLSLGLLLGGAIGNLIDRIRFGAVTDFIHFPHYPSFNVADSCITVGIFVIAGFFLLIEGRKPEAQTNDS